MSVNVVPMEGMVPTATTTADATRGSAMRVAELPTAPVEDTESPVVLGCSAPVAITAIEESVTMDVQDRDAPFTPTVTIDALLPQRLVTKTKVWLIHILYNTKGYIKQKLSIGMEGGNTVSIEHSK